MTFTIYCHTSPSGKRYVGQTIHSMADRWSRHVYAAKRNKPSCVLLQAAIRKYGSEAFTHEVLEEVGTQGEANAAERRWIEALGSRMPGGYNVDAGGGGRRMHDETKRKISDATRRFHAAKTPEERSEAQRRRCASLPAEKRSAVAVKRWGDLTPEQRSERVKKGHRARTPETRARAGEARREAWARCTPEQRREHGQKVGNGHRARQRTQAAALVQERVSRVIAEARSRREADEAFRRAQLVNREAFSRSFIDSW